MVSIQEEQCVDTLSSHNDMRIFHNNESNSFVNDEENQDYILEFCHTVVPLWNENAKFAEMDGGLSNKQYEISITRNLFEKYANTTMHEGKDITKVVYHAFSSPNTRFRVLEQKVLQRLRECNISTTFIGECSKGRISYFQEGATMTTKEFCEPKHIYPIAMRQGQQNTIEILNLKEYKYRDGNYKSTTWILLSKWYEELQNINYISRIIADKLPSSYPNFTSFCSLNALYNMPNHALEIQLYCQGNWKGIDKYITFKQQEIQKNTKKSFLKRLTLDKEVLLLYLLDIGELVKETYILCKIYTQTYNIPLLFSHNDCHSRNVIYKSDADDSDYGIRKYSLIDFEYAFYNFRGFDIANAALESTVKYTNTYPGFEFDCTGQMNLFQGETLDEQTPCERAQIEGYIEGYERTLNECNDTNSPFYTPGASNKQEMPTFDILIKEIRWSIQQSHLQWIFWALRTSQKKLPENNFGYLEYAFVRKQQYMYYKEIMLPDVNKQIKGLMNNIN